MSNISQNTSDTIQPLRIVIVMPIKCFFASRSSSASANIGVEHTIITECAHGIPKRTNSSFSFRFAVTKSYHWSLVFMHNKNWYRTALMSPLFCPKWWEKRFVITKRLNPIAKRLVSYRQKAIISLISIVSLCISKYTKLLIVYF